MGGGGGGGQAVRRGMQRHLFLVVDLSQAMDDALDMKPSRLAVTLKIVEVRARASSRPACTTRSHLTCACVPLQSFIKEYFEQNPIAQLGVVIMRNGGAEKLSELGGTCALARSHVWRRIGLDRIAVDGRMRG
jgi:transcription initiation factor TFIIH subunit 2